MCGVPVHAAEGYLLTLIRKGFRVAVCEQMEDPAEARKRGAKSVVRREVVRLVTPGTLTEESLLEARRHNYLAAFAEVRGEGAFAWVDVSTGDLDGRAVPAGRARADAGAARRRARCWSREAQEAELRELLAEAGAVATPLARASFDSTAGRGAGRGDLRGARRSTASAAFGRAEIGGAGRDRRLSRADPERAAAAAAAAGARGRRRADADRRRDPAQPRADPQPRRAGARARCSPPIDRTVTGGGARLLETRLNGALDRRRG